LAPYAKRLIDGVGEDFSTWLLRTAPAGYCASMPSSFILPFVKVDSATNCFVRCCSADVGPVACLVDLVGDPLMILAVLADKVKI
jgi:hypothetical protein